MLGRSLYTGTIKPGRGPGRSAALMLKVRVIPCLDVKDGRVVKGVQFVALRDAGDPVEQAQAYDAAGADELMFLDITASHEGRGAILDVIARTADVCFMPLSSAAASARWRTPGACCCAGADKVSINTAAVEDPRPAAPLRRRLRQPGGGRRHRRQAGRAPAAGTCSPTAAARTPASTRSSTPRLAVAKGAGEILLTSMDRDGAKTGYDIALLRAVTRRRRRAGDRLGRRRATPRTWSRRCSDGGADAVLAASIFHFGEVSDRRGQARHGRRPASRCG